MWDARRPRLRPTNGAFAVLFAALSLSLCFACGEEGLLPTTVDPGADFTVADVVFDEGYFYCQVEPVLFQNSCGGGDPSQGDPAGGCHFAVTSFRLTDYMPRVSETCSGNTPAPGSVVEVARQNYRAAQARMKQNPDLAPLLTRPTGQAAHPREIFAEDSEAAEVIRQWANQFSSQ
jgi:hypothetical protein